jgi:hypothetical protein
LLKVLSAQGVETVFIDGSWQFVGPEEVLTDEVCKLLVEQKVELYELLAGTASNRQEMASGEELFPDHGECWDVCLQCGTEACIYDDYGQAFCGDSCYWAYHYPCEDLLESACHIGEVSCELDLASIGGQSSTGFKQSLERCFANAQAEDQRVIQRGAGDAGDISVGSQGENLRWFESSAEDAEDAEDFLSNFQGKNKIEYQEKKKYRKKGGRVLRVLRRAREVICHKPPFDWGPLLCRPPSPPSMAKDPSG